MQISDPRFSKRISFFSYVYKQVIPSCLLTRGDELSEKNGDYLLSHLRSTIGVTKLNFSVRNGKRWNPQCYSHLNKVDMMYKSKD